MTAAPHKVRPAELARLLDVSRQSIHEHITRGTLTVDRDGLLDVELSRIAIANRVRPHGKTAQAVMTPPPAAAAAATAPPADAAAPLGMSSYHVAKTLREAAGAKMAQLDLAEREGRLVDAERVRAHARATAATLAQRLDQIPHRIAAEFGADDAQRRAIAQRIREELDAARAAIAAAAEAAGGHA